MAALRAQRPGCSWCRTPIVPRELTGRRLAHETQRILHPMLMCTRHSGGGHHSAVRHCTHSAVCHALLYRFVLHCTMCAVLQRTVLRTTLHRMRCAARHRSVHCAGPCALCQWSGMAHHTHTHTHTHVGAPPPPCRRDPPPLPAWGIVVCPAPSPSTRAQTGRASHAWPADMQSHWDSHCAPPRRAVSQKLGPQIKSN